MATIDSRDATADQDRLTIGGDILGCNYVQLLCPALQLNGYSPKCITYYVRNIKSKRPFLLVSSLLSLCLINGSGIGRRFSDAANAPYTLLLLLGKMGSRSET